MLTIWETVRHTDIVTLKITNRDLRMPYATVSFRMTLSDLEWLSKIFSDTKRRAVSLRQLSFLSVNVLPSQQWNNSQNRLTFAKFGMVFWLKVYWHKSGIDIKEICYKNIVAHNRKIEQLMWLTLDLSSSRVKDTLGHTLTPDFSGDSELLRYFPAHADAFQILLYFVYPVLSWSSRLILQCTACLGSLLSSIRRTCPSHLSILSFMIWFIFSSYVCARTLTPVCVSVYILCLYKRKKNNLLSSDMSIFLFRLL